MALFGYIGFGSKGYIGMPRHPALLDERIIAAEQLAAAGAVASTTIVIGTPPVGAIYAGASFLLSAAFDGAGIVWATGLLGSLSYDQVNDPNRLAGLNLDASFSFDGARSGGLSIGAPIGGQEISFMVNTPDTTLDQLDVGALQVGVWYFLPR